MRQMLFIMSLLIVLGADAKQKIVTGKVTHISADAVFTSIGMRSGVRDSTLLYVVSRRDTVAVLEVFAVSSETSAGRVVRAKRTISVGNEVVALLPESRSAQGISDTTTRRAGKANGRPTGGEQRVGKDDSFLAIEGRVSAQYLTTSYETSAFDFSQPGLILNLRGSARGAPVKFEVYSAIRSSSLGGASPFSSGATNRTRIYRLSLAYDDGTTLVSAGRILPPFAMSIGYVDGVLLSQRFGNLVIGSAFGLQPSLTLRGASTDAKKIALFANYRSNAPVNVSLSTAYARTYFQSHLDREVIGIQVNVVSSSALFIFATSEVDLRRKSGDELDFSPSLTNVFTNLNYRLTNFVTVSLGADASRPFNPFSSVRSIPDSLLDDRLRSGVNMGVNFTLPGGIMVYNTYSPRSSESSFGQDYSNYSSLSFSDILSTGASVRSHASMTENTFSYSRGFGFNVQRNFNGMFDLSIRYQQNMYTVRQLGERDRSSAVGGDVLVPITDRLSALMSYERVEGFGSNSHSLFIEINVRF